jgi:CheY-like chemotaxis protein
MRVLIVDDGADVRFMLRLVLEEAGVTVDEASSGSRAIQILAQDPDIDVAVLDQRMPLMTGLEVARTLRESGEGRPLVLFSAYLHPDTHDEARELGLTVVDKTDITGLVDVVRDVLTTA